MEESNEDHNVIPELYFLIAKFLSNGPLKETAKTLLKELDSAEVLPRRLDWEGVEHSQSYHELASQFAELPAGRLAEVARAALRAARGSLSVRRSLLRAAAPAPPARTVHAVPYRLMRRELGLSTGSPLTPRVLAGLRLQRRTLGHLSAVYCLAFDCTGRYVMTGADDLLVKVWSAVDGRLLGTLRGCSAEVTDACVSADGRLLAVGSVERLVRVWELAGGAPRAVLAAHAGTITSVHWAPPARRDLRHLASTSTDGSVAFWTCSPDGAFLSQPVQYVERMRPGASHMICAAWSAGGAFLAAGSADHHVRVYAVQTEPPGPRRVLETAAHADAVDSIAWAHRALRFVSGSKDGSAALWALHATQWRHVPLRPAPDRPDAKLKVTMVCWDRSDAWVLTAVSDCTVRVWGADGAEARVLRGHSDEAYVLEPHPAWPGVALSAGHDGRLCVWDAARGELLAAFRNTIEGQGEGALFDAKWAGDVALAATDSHGHLLLLGLGAGHPRLQQLPTELFFHTDYRPVVRDALGGALDEQAGLPPHLLPPPFLVDVEGAPHAAALQRLVPGRERAPQPALPAAPRAPPAAGVWRGAGVRLAGDWGARDALPPSAAPMVPLLPPAAVRHIEERAAALNHMEMEWWRREMRRRPLMISTAPRGRGAARPRPRPRPRPRAPSMPHSSSSSTNELSSSVHLSSSDSSDWEEPRPRVATRRRAARQSASSRASVATLPSPPASPLASPAPSPAPSPPRRSPSPASPASPLPGDAWLLSPTPRKTPYTPQLGDEVVYFRVGHQRYFEAVAEKDIYKVQPRDKPWERMHIYDAEAVVVTGIRYAVRGAARVAALRVGSARGGRAFTVRYHDMPDVIDFMVLRAHYEGTRQWAAGEPFQCSIDSRWWRGVLLEPAPPARAWPDPAPDTFLGARVRWDNGEVERLSPWDLEPLSASRAPPEWPEQAALAGQLRRVMSLALAEPFLAPPPRAAYPLDLSVMHARCERLWYRRPAAAAHDARCLVAAHRAKGGPLLRALLLACIERPGLDVLAQYRALAAAGAGPAAPRRVSAGWRRAALSVLARLCSSPDAAPFLRPVCAAAAPDYGAVVARPMDLGTVRARLAAARYASPDHCRDDLRLIFSNSRLYNTNKRSRIYSMTVRLSSLFESLWSQLLPRGRTRGARLSDRHTDSSSWSGSEHEPLAATSRRQRAIRDTLHTRRKGKGVGKKSKSSSTSAETAGPAPRADSPREAHDSPHEVPHDSPHESPPRDNRDDEEYIPLANGEEYSEGEASGEYSRIEVLEEVLDDEEVELTYSDNSDRDQPLSRSVRKRGRESDSSYGARNKRSRRKHARRGSRSSESSHSSSSESDGSYRPRDDSDDDTPLHLFRQQRPAGDAEAGPSSATHNGRRRGRPRRAPARRYNEDSSDSAGAISQRARTRHDTDHTYHNGHGGGHGGARERDRDGARAERERDAGDGAAVSVSSRGRVRRLTAKARGLLHD